MGLFFLVPSASWDSTVPALLVIGRGTGNPTGCRVGYCRVGVRVGFSPPGLYPYPKPGCRRVLVFFLQQMRADQELQLIQGIMVLTLRSHSEIVPPFQLRPLLHCDL
jgi:hypothetical protein